MPTHLCVCLRVCMRVHTAKDSRSFIHHLCHPYTLLLLSAALHGISPQVEYARAHASIRGCKYLELMALIVRAKLHDQAGKCNEVQAMLQHTK